MRTTRRWVLAAAAAALMISDRAIAQNGQNGSNGNVPNSGSGGPGTLGTEVPPYSENADLAYHSRVPRDLQPLEYAVQRLHANHRNAVDLAALAERHPDPKVQQYARRLAANQERLDAQLVMAAHGSGLDVSGPAYRAEDGRNQKSMATAAPPSGSSAGRPLLSSLEALSRSASKNADALAKQAREFDRPGLASLAEDAKRSVNSQLAVARALASEPTTGTGAGGSAR